MRACYRGRGPETLERSLNFQTEIRHDAVGDVVEILKYVDDAVKRRDRVAVYEGVRHRITSRKAARYGHEVTDSELAARLRLNQFQHIRDGHAGHRIMCNVPPCVKCWLKVDASDGRMANCEIDDLSDFVFVDAALDCRNERHAQSDFGQAVKGADLFFKDVWLIPQNAVSIRVEAVKLEIDRGADLVEPFQEVIVFSDTLAVGIDHHRTDAAELRCPNEVGNLRMDCGFASRELNDLGSAFGAHEVIEHLFDFFHGETEARTSVGKTKRAVHVAGTVHFNDAKAAVLRMIDAQSAVMRTS